MQFADFKMPKHEPFFSIFTPNFHPSIIDFMASKNSLRLVLLDLEEKF